MALVDDGTGHLYENHMDWNGDSWVPQVAGVTQQILPMGGSDNPQPATWTNGDPTAHRPGSPPT